MQHTREDRGQHQVGVGVGTRHAMLQPPGGAARERDADRDRPVLVAPGWCGRREGTRAEPAERVVVRREDRGEVGHRGAQSTDGVPQQPAAAAAVVEDIAPVPVEEAQMGVHPAAGGMAERLGHEARDQAMRASAALDRALEQGRLVGSQQRVGLMPQIDLELTRAVLGDQRVGRDALGAGRDLDRGEHRLQPLELVETQNAGVRGRASRRRLARRHGPAIRTPGRLHQIEFQLDRNDRGEAALGEPAEDTCQHMPWIAEERAAVGLVHREHELGRRALRPGHRLEGPRHRAAEGVAIAGLLGIARRRHVVAPDIEGQHRSWHGQTTAEHLVQAGRRQTLATRDPVLVDHEQVGGRDLGVCGEEGPGLVGRIDEIRRRRGTQRLAGRVHESLSLGGASRHCDHVP